MIKNKSLLEENQFANIIWIIVKLGAAASDGR